MTIDSRFVANTAMFIFDKVYNAYENKAWWYIPGGAGEEAVKCVKNIATKLYQEVDAMPTPTFNGNAGYNFKSGIKNAIGVVMSSQTSSTGNSGEQIAADMTNYLQLINALVEHCFSAVDDTPVTWRYACAGAAAYGKRFNVGSISGTYGGAIYGIAVGIDGLSYSSHPGP